MYYIVLPKENGKLSTDQNLILSLPLFLGGTGVVSELLSVINDFNLAKNNQKVNTDDSENTE